MADITLDLTTPDGKPAETLADIIRLRNKVLGETAVKSCTALAQNILASLRAQTKVADEDKMDIAVADMSSLAVVSCKQVGGKRRPCLRSPGRRAPELKFTQRVYWLSKDLRNAKVFRVDDMSIPKKKVQFIVVADSQSSALEFGKAWHKRQVKKYKGLARCALSLARRQLFAQTIGADEVEGEKVLAKAQSLTTTSVQDNGFASGQASVDVHDGVNYATLALKNGESSLDYAVQAATNKMLGYLRQKAKEGGIRGAIHADSIQEISRRAE